MNPGTMIQSGLQRREAPILTLLATFLFAALWSGVAGVSLPGVHDESAYLLQAEMVRQGHWAEAAPAFPEFFETFHVLVHQVYAGKYPPGQPLLLAAGSLIGGHPIVGVWLGWALLAGALHWALRPVVGPMWAAMAGWGINAQAGLFVWWGQSYWGGAAAAAGGALLIGASLRLAKRSTWRDGLAAAAGVALVAGNRPYEGLVFVLALAVVQALLMWRTPGFAWGRTALRWGLPLTVSGAMILSVFAWQHREVTGSVMQFPHTLWSEYKGGHPLLREYAGSEARSLWVKFWSYAVLWAAPVGWLGWLGLRRWRPAREVLPASVAVLACLGVVLQNRNGHPHYLAPAFGGLYALAWIGLSRFRPQRWAGALAATWLMVGGAWLGWWAVRPTFDWRHERAQIHRELESLGGRHIVFVRYQPHHTPLYPEYVYNGSSLPEQSVWWVRDLGAAKNTALLAAYPHRRGWWLDADSRPNRPQPTPP